MGTGNVLNTYGIFTGKYIAAREPFIDRVGCLIKRLHWFFTQIDFIHLLVVEIAYTDLHVFTEEIISTLKRETTTDKDTAWVPVKDNVDHRITQDVKLTNDVHGSQKLHRFLRRTTISHSVRGCQICFWLLTSRSENSLSAREGSYVLHWLLMTSFDLYLSEIAGRT